MNIAIMNSSYQIIWEKVIMSRHPEAKNLKEALKKESEIFGSVAVVALSENEGHVWNRKATFEATFIAEGFPCRDHSAYYFFDTQDMVNSLYLSAHGAIGRVDCCSTERILGRPITLEDVLVLLTKNLIILLACFSNILVSSLISDIDICLLTPPSIKYE